MRLGRNPLTRKETTMQYKTIVLELLQQRPAMHEQLRQARQLLPALDSYALDLKNRHEAWKEQLAQARPESDPSQIASEALEMALKEMEEQLDSGASTETEPLSLDGAMAFIRKHTSSD